MIFTLTPKEWQLKREKYLRRWFNKTYGTITSVLKIKTDNRNRVFDCHSSPDWRQMRIENTVSIDFWFCLSIVKSVFDCRLPCVINIPHLFLLNFFKNSHLTYTKNYVFCHFVVYLFLKIFLVWPYNHTYWPNWIVNLTLFRRLLQPISTWFSYLKHFLGAFYNVDLYNFTTARLAKYLSLKSNLMIELSC